MFSDHQAKAWNCQRPKYVGNRQHFDKSPKPACDQVQHLTLGTSKFFSLWLIVVIHTVRTTYSFLSLLLWQNAQKKRKRKSQSLHEAGGQPCPQLGGRERHECQWWAGLLLLLSRGPQPTEWGHPESAGVFLPQRAQGCGNTNIAPACLMSTVSSTTSLYSCSKSRIFTPFPISWQAQAFYLGTFHIFFLSPTSSLSLLEFTFWDGIYKLPSPISHPFFPLNKEVLNFSRPQSQPARGIHFPGLIELGGYAAKF